MSYDIAVKPCYGKYYSVDFEIKKQNSLVDVKEVIIEMKDEIKESDALKDMRVRIKMKRKLLVIMKVFLANGKSYYDEIESFYNKEQYEEDMDQYEEAMDQYEEDIEKSNYDVRESDIDDEVTEWY